METAAGLALVAAYLDSKYLVRRDIKLLYNLARIRLYFKKAARNFEPHSFLTQLEKLVETVPDKPILIYPRQICHEYPERYEDGLDHLFEVERYTAKQLYENVLKTANMLKSRYDVQPKEVVCLNLQNGPQYVFLWFALWTLGAIPAMINNKLVSSSLEHSIKISEARLVLYDESVQPAMEAIQSAIPQTCVLIDDQWICEAFSLRIYRAPDSCRSWHGLAETAMMIYTSGTTGLPKSAKVSWRRVLTTPRAYGKDMKMNANTIMYSPMPLFHSTGAIMGLLSVLHHGGTYAIGTKFSARTFWTQVKLSDANCIQYVGETCRYLLNSPQGPDDTSHSAITACGSGMKIDVWGRFKERFGIKYVGELYGATELPMALTVFQSGEFGEGCISLCGPLAKAVMNKIAYAVVRMDPDDPTEIYRNPQTGFCERVRPNEPGQFLVRAPDPQNLAAFFPGYHKNPAATEAKICRNVFKRGDAYVNSGDLIRVTPDGPMYFADRLGDTFRWKSENVSTTQVEAAFQGIPNIVQVAVVGKSVPNHDGRAGFAVIETNGPLDMDNLSHLMQSRLPSFAVPVFLKLTSEAMEVTGTLKIRKEKFKTDDEFTGDLYWWNRGRYQKLTTADWNAIISGKSKL
ncbi:very long-chain fatty acid transport protein [Trichomonascus vanleenenianus]|uniref:very long-chain fatty acid transport protein n=1 Tax=Trichomonascus vanleenenianus TaxID=2268995 RepID=UPI003ECA77BC